MKDNAKKLNQIIKKIYARELDLIEEVPVTAIRNTGKHWFASVKNSLWLHQSTAIRIIMLALAIAVVSAAIYYYNTFTVNKYKFMLERAQIEAHLQRRNDLIPNLVAAVSDYMGYEQKIFIHAADVRSAVSVLEESVKVDKTASIMSALSKFQAVAENYPDLKASVAYQTLMRELSDTETMIADMRASYNKAANYYNSRLKMFPGNTFNIIFRFKPVNTFASEEHAKEAPQIK